MAKQTKDKKELGKSFLQRVLEKLPEQARASVGEALLSDDLAEFAGEAVLMKEDYSTLAQTAAETKRLADAHKTMLDDWWVKKQGENADLRAKVTQLEASGKRRPAADDDPEPEPQPARPAPAADVVTKQDLQTALSQGLADVATLTTIAGQHQLEFGEPLDVHKLIAHAVQSGRPVANGGYDSFVAERRAVKSDQARKKEIEEAEARGAKKAREEFQRAQSGPPDATAALSASFAEGTLRGLNLKPEDRAKQFGTEAAVAGLFRRRQEKAG
jgi:hypothetical protein